MFHSTHLPGSSTITMIYLFVVCLVQIYCLEIDDHAIAITSDQCTSIAVSKGATSDGSTMATHTADCFDCDWRINKVPARDWPEGSMRPIYLLTGSYPRQVRNDRGYTWSTDNLDDGLPLEGVIQYNNGTEVIEVVDTDAFQSYGDANTSSPLRKIWESQVDTEILGYIPQVPHTYGLIEGLYGIMNEFQVSIGESTCGAKLFAAPVGYDGNGMKVVDGATEGVGKALMEVSELTQIALERCKTAREAVLLMGKLAMQYGYYSSDWSVANGLTFAMAEGGEALTVTDPNEVWMMHMLPDPTGSSAIWCAQRVPDGHITAVANTFVIRDVVEMVPYNLESVESDFLYSSNMYTIAENMGWWSRADNLPLNFLKTFAPPRHRGEYSHRRIWRIFNVFAPSAHLPDTTNAFADDYPFSIEVDRRLTIQDVIDIQRDHYEGTRFSLTEGIASGPYGDPNRYDPNWNNPLNNLTLLEAMDGEFPRAISMFRTSYSFIAHNRGYMPDALSLLYFSQYAPHVAAYTPIYVNSETLPPSWIRGSMHKYDTNSAWWNFNAVGNVAEHFYVYAMQSVRFLQKSVERHIDASLKEFEENMMTKYDTLLGPAGTGTRMDHPDYASLVLDMTRYAAKEAESISHQYKLLLPLILTKYRDGIVVTHLMDTSGVTIIKDFYPKWYLRLVGYFVPGYTDPGTILTSAGPDSTPGTGSSEMLVHHIEYIFLLYIFIGVLVGYSTHYYINSLGMYIVSMWNTKSTTATTTPHPNSNSNSDYTAMEMNTNTNTKHQSHSYIPISGVDQGDMSDRPFSMFRNI